MAWRDGVQLNPVMLTGFCWLAADAYWMVTSRKTKRTVARTQSRSSRSVYVTCLLLGFALFYLPLSGVPVLGWRVLPRDRAVETLGVLVCAAGVGFAIWARHVLGRNWSGVPTLKEDHTLIQEGPFALVRHPIYLGLLTGMVGTALVIGELRALLPLANILGVWRKIAAEEALLRSAFPAEYPAYAQRVKKLVPGIL